MVESCVDSKREADARKGERVLGLVKDGTFYEAFRSESGELLLVEDAAREHLPVSCDTVKGVRVARVDCGENCYIFDRQVLMATLRNVLEFARNGAGGLVLDVSRVSLVAATHMNALRHLHDDLAERGRRLVLVTGSAVIAREVLAAVPELAGRIFAREEHALACAKNPLAVEAAG